MHILHINELYGRAGGGGTEQYLPNFCELLEQAGHRSSVIYGTDTAASPQDYGPHVHYVPSVGYWSSGPNWRKLAEVLAIVTAERPDVVEIHQIADDHLVEELHQRAPLVVFVHNHVFTCPSGSRLKKEPLQVCTDHGSLACLPKMIARRCGSRRPDQIYDGLQRLHHTQRMLRHAERIVVDAAYMRDELVRHGFDGDRISVSPSITELPPRGGPLPDAPEVLYVGGLVENKGPQHLVAALALVEQPWRLTIVGEGFLREQLERQVAQLGLQERVRFAGWVHKADIGRYYEAAQVVVVPSLWPEPLGLVGAEAMAYERPVVAYDAGGIGEWLADSETGLLAPWGDVDALAHCIARLLSDRALALRLGSGGRKRLETHLHPQQHLTHMVHVYQQAIDDWRERSTANIQHPTPALEAQ